METVQLQCGSCKKLMAISVAHLGGQVQCPHCRAVVQTPAPTPAPAPPAPALGNQATMALERESIFAGPESSEDVFGGGATQMLVEYPAEPAPAPRHEVSATLEFNPDQQPEHEAASAPMHFEPELNRHEAASVPHWHEPPSQEEDLPASQPRVNYSTGTGLLYAMIFLVPYSILATIAIVYLLLELGKQPHPLDMLPDPSTGKGGARKVERIKHDYPLAAHQKIGLGQAVRVGALEVQAQKVALNAEGDLVLNLRVKNLSTDQVFAPISDPFLHVQADVVGGKPYTFLQSETFKPVYGGFLHMRQGERDNPTGEMTPGQEETIALTTMDSDRKLVSKIAASKDRLLWRVQLRRGLVSFRGKSVSATSVVGVQFNASDLKRS
jgi:phage FluMu protein Com